MWNAKNAIVPCETVQLGTSREEYWNTLLQNATARQVRFAVCGFSYFPWVGGANGKSHVESHYPTQAKERLEWGTRHFVRCSQNYGRFSVHAIADNKYWVAHSSLLGLEWDSGSRCGTSRSPRPPKGYSEKLLVG
jgi:hypothetical protein